MSRDNFNIKLIRILKLYMDVIVSCIAFMGILGLDNSQKSLRYLGILIIFVSFYLLIKVRINTTLIILFGVIMYINMSVSLGDLLQIGQSLGNETLVWQLSVRMSEFNALGAKCILLVMTILNLMLDRKFIEQVGMVSNEKIQKKNNNLIFYIGMIVLFVFWYFGYGSPIGDTYQSNTRTIYEYSLVVFVVVWFYSGKSKMHKNLLNFYAIIYVIQALSRGDRSSAFPMILIIFLIHNFKIDLKKLATLAIAGIISSNIISIYRIYGASSSISDMKELYFEKYGMSAFLSDTVSQSYYTGISILNVHEIVPNPSHYFFDFIGGIIFGGGFRNADVGAIAYNYLLNKGGGFYFSWFYFWFGFLGVIIGSLILGYIIRFLFKSTNNYVKLYTITFTAMSFRWYLYTPFVLFRSVFFVFTLLLLISHFVHKITVKKQMEL